MCSLQPPGRQRASRRTADGGSSPVGCIANKSAIRGDRESEKYRSMNPRNDTHSTTMYHRARRYCSVSLFWAAYERCLESECASLPSAEDNGEKKNERE